MIRHGVGMIHHLGEPFDPRIAGLPLQEVWTLGPFAFERVAVVGQPLLSGPVLIDHTLNVVLGDARPELTDRHRGGHTRRTLNITSAATADTYPARPCLGRGVGTVGDERLRLDLDVVG
ncbi:hypothetical protein KXD97_31570 (plasmid) [Mycobacterium sp. SMC-8]|uniref:hypothetical protein n=1 Tax=Mycobacterium sp. SMC-8 TaxID=2857060 RepID=UPI0005CB1F63|nr:hypothetical protein [Mycobacterium sp. SMC-8]UXA15674.1 hypothetical protein KXD97_31570 [Mycobacterium sp. SMC-8]